MFDPDFLIFAVPIIIVLWFVGKWIDEEDEKKRKREEKRRREEIRKEVMEVLREQEEKALDELRYWP